MKQYKIIVTDKSSLYIFLFNCICFILGVLTFIFDYIYITAFCTFIINILFLYKFRNKIPVFILFFFILLHSKIFIYQTLFNVQISFWTDFLYDKSINTVLLAHLIFIFTLGSVINTKTNKFDFQHKLINIKNKFIYWIIFLISIYIILYGITGDNIIDTGSYSNSGNTEKSTLHEYFLLFYVTLICFSPNKFINKILELLLLCVYIFKTLLYGGRIEVVEIFLIYTLLFYILPGKLKLKQVLLFLLIGIYLSSVVSNFRSNPAILFSNEYIELFNPSSIYDFPKNGEHLSSTEGDVVQSSIRIVGLINSNQITLKDRIVSFFSYILSPIIPQSLLPKISNLSTYKQDEFRSGGGGLISTYFYSWLWYFGPFLIAIFLGIFINKFFEFKSYSSFIYGITILSTFPRWFSYNPIFLIKFCLFTVIFFQIMKIAKENLFSVRYVK